MKGQKLFSVLVVVVLVALSVRAGYGAENGETAVGQNVPEYFHTEGSDLVSDSTGQKKSFRGVNVTGLEYGSFFDNPYPGQLGTDYFLPRAEDFFNLKEAGANVVRVPIEWARLITGWKPTDPLPDSLDSQYLNLIDEVVRMSSSREIYVIFDLHDFLKYWEGKSAQVCVDSSALHQQLLARTWKILATRYRNEPAVLGYDIMNEPVRRETGESCGSCNWPEIAQSVVNAIRSVDTKHLIFVEGKNYSLAGNWSIENPAPFVTDTVTPPRIVYSPHIFLDANNDSRYDQADEAVEPIENWPYYVRDRFLPVFDWSRKYDVPIFLGELGVPCSLEWKAVLNHAFVSFLEPTQTSVLLWHYIDPVHCLIGPCPLNLAACPGNYQLQVLEQHPGGVYSTKSGPQVVPRESLIYGGGRLNPWDAGNGYWGDVRVNTDCVNGDCFLSVEFWKPNYDGVKFAHHYGVDTNWYVTLTFEIGFLPGGGSENFKVFTTSPNGDCRPGLNPEYPIYEERPTLQEFLPAGSAAWRKVEIPLTRIVDPSHPIINGIAFQNMGSVQKVFYLKNVMLEQLPVNRPFKSFLPLVLK